MCHMSEWLGRDLSPVAKARILSSIRLSRLVSAPVQEEEATMSLPSPRNPELKKPIALHVCPRGFLTTSVVKETVPSAAVAPRSSQLDDVPNRRSSQLGDARNPRVRFVFEPSRTRDSGEGDVSAGSEEDDLSTIAEFPCFRDLEWYSPAIFDLKLIESWEWAGNASAEKHHEDASTTQASACPPLSDCATSP